MVFCLENLLGGFSCCCSFIFVSSFHFCIFILLLLFFISFPGCFSMSPALHPDFSGPWRPPSALSSTPTTFYCLYFCIYPKRYGFEWVFFTHRRFLPYALSPTFLTQPASTKASLGAGSSSLKLAGLHTDPWNTDQAHLLNIANPSLNWKENWKN